MARFRFDLATADDDEELRAVLAGTPMDGDMVISFRRDPSYFDASVVAGQFRQTVVGRDSACGRIVGFGERSVRHRFVNGQPCPVGYLSSLRVLPEYRNLGLIARGYKFFRQLDEDGRTSLYLTTIAEGNTKALAMLTSGRAGLPPYREAGRFLTLAIPVRRRGKTLQSKRGDDRTVRSAVREDIPQIIDFLQNEGAQRQFFPCYRMEDFLDPDGTFRNLEIGNLLLAFRDQRLVGTLAVWDQRSFRQSIVERYSLRLTWVRPWYNARARLLGRPPLPGTGNPLPYVVAAVPLVAENDESIFAALLGAARRRAAEMSATHLLIGLHATDPLVAHAQRHAVARYVTHLYYVHWPHAEREAVTPDGRTAYLELGTL